ncbi:hypothetical protein PG993_013510 [Apiospora rasikravindrae]|uniref:Uncharacterized protein n=1 Tax=Apiospora rasikravindrae TaxID=990691 RepID=A0ABR1RXY1_9PEZI
MVRQSHLNLGFELVEWLGFVTTVRLDNTAMIDYLDELYEKSFAATGRRIPINNWAGLDQTVFQQDGSPAMRMTNAVHIINRFAARSRAMATHLTSYQDVWVTSDDFLPLAQACHNGLVAVYNSAPEPDLNTIHVARARMLHHALGSRVGVPGTVRWLALVARVPLFADGRHAVQCLLEYGLRHNPYLLRENMNVLLELVGINEVFPGGHLDAGVRDARPLDLLIFEDAPLVELVARGGVDLTLANPVTVQYCVGRRALRSDRIDMRGNGMPLVEIMRSENIPYDIKRRILHWCIVRSTNNAVGQMSDI